MATLTIDELPDELYERLNRQAERHERRTEEEALACLEQSLPPDRRDAEAVIAEAEALNRRVGRVLPDIVNEAKREGRA